MPEKFSITKAALEALQKTDRSKLPKQPRTPPEDHPWRKLARAPEQPKPEKPKRKQAKRGPYHKPERDRIDSELKTLFPPHGKPPPDVTNTDIVRAVRTGCGVLRSHDTTILRRAGRAT
jgi:hypothetical protein